MPKTNKATITWEIFAWLITFWPSFFLDLSTQQSTRTVDDVQDGHFTSLS